MRQLLEGDIVSRIRNVSMDTSINSALVRLHVDTGF